MKLFHGDIEVNKWYEEEQLVLKSYYGENLIYGEEEPAPSFPNLCYGVTDNIATYTARTFDEVYDKTQKNWYMLNNLNQYEQYGVYADNKATYYDGKLAAINNHEWKYTNGAWVDLGEMSGGETRISLGDDSSSLEGTSFPTTFKIAKSQLCGEYASFTISFNDGAGSLSFNYDHYGDEAYLLLDYRDYSLQTFASIPYTEDEDYYYFAPDEYTEGVPDSVTIESATASNDCQMPFDVIIGSVAYIEEYAEKDAPTKMLIFASMEEANSYSGCVYAGIMAIINGEGYYLDENYEWVQKSEYCYLNFTAKNGNATIGMKSSGTTNVNVAYSFDLETWTTWNYSNITIPNGKTIYFKGDNRNHFSLGTKQYKKFTMSGTIEGGGNIMSLLYGNDFEWVDSFDIPNQYCFCFLFSGCTSLTTPPQLPATTLMNNCYRGMFSSCANLTQAPNLPATTMKNECYSFMFYGCTSLTTAPTLSATTLVNSCYNYMFANCSSLNYIKAMFTTTPSSTYTSSWVNGVAASGTFVKNSAATWTTTGVNGVPTGWTVQTETPN